MVFLSGKLLDLQIPSPSIDWGEILNNRRYLEGSQLGKIPLIDFKNPDNNNLILAIMSKKPQGFIGRVSIENINYINRCGELKIFIKGDFQGKGYATEACELIMRHAFDELNLQRIELGTLETNTSMQALAEKLKFRKEGIRKRAVYKDGKYVDVIEYGFLKRSKNSEEEISSC